MSAQGEIDAGKRFAFGENWTRFLADLDDQRIADAEASLRQMLGVQDLAGKTFLMGSDFTVADGYLFTVTNWAKPLGLDLSAYPHLVAYRERVAARPAVKEAMTAEGLHS